MNDKVKLVIQKMVREELNRQLPRLIAEVYKDLKIELLEYTLKIGNAPIVERSSQQPTINDKSSGRTLESLRGAYGETKPKGKVNLSSTIKNPILRDILSETEPLTEDVSELPTGYVEGIEGKMVPVNETVASVMRNFDRDYSQVLKLADEKVKRIREGGV